MRRRHNPSNVVPLIALGGGALLFFVGGKANQLGPLQGVYNAVVNPTNVAISATPAGTLPAGSVTPSPGVNTTGGSGAVSTGGTNPYTFVTNYRYVAAAPGGWIVVYNGSQRGGVYANQNDAQNAYNAIAAAGG